MYNFPQKKQKISKEKSWMSQFRLVWVKKYGEIVFDLLLRFWRNLMHKKNSSDKNTWIQNLNAPKEMNWMLRLYYSSIKVSEHFRFYHFFECVNWHQTDNKNGKTKPCRSEYASTCMFKVDTISLLTFYLCLCRRWVWNILSF